MDSDDADLAILARISEQDEFDEVCAEAIVEHGLEEAQLLLADLLWKRRGRWQVKPMAFSATDYAQHMLDRAAALSRQPPATPLRQPRSNLPPELPTSYGAQSVLDCLCCLRPAPDVATMIRSVAAELANDGSLGSYNTLKRRLQRLQTSTRVPERFADQLFTTLGHPEVVQTLKPWQSTAHADVTARERRACSPGIPYETLTGGRSSRVRRLVERGWLLPDGHRRYRPGHRLAEARSYDAYVKEWRVRTGRPRVDDETCPLTCTHGVCR